MQQASMHHASCGEGARAFGAACVSGPGEARRQLQAGQLQTWRPVERSTRSFGGRPAKLTLKPPRRMQAVEALEEAVDLDADVPKGYSNLAIAYTRMFEKSAKPSDAKEALSMFELALDVEPESVSLHTNYGILLAQVRHAPPCRAWGSHPLRHQGLLAVEVALARSRSACSSAPAPPHCHLPPHRAPAPTCLPVSSRLNGCRETPCGADRGNHSASPHPKRVLASRSPPLTTLPKVDTSCTALSLMYSNSKW
jgi:hypothetical protein